MNENYFKDLFVNVDKNIKLDTDQINIVKDNSNVLMVVAGAGSGKTTTITAKVKYLVEIKKISPKEILVISYTNKAVNELSDYINDKFNLDIHICTFHKFAYDILKEISNIKLINNKDKIIKKIVLSYNDKQNLNKLWKEYKKSPAFQKNISFSNYLVQLAIENLNLFKAYNINLPKIKIQRFRNVMKFLKWVNIKYSEYCEINNLCDFDDLIIKSEEMLRLNKVNLNYKYIIIDEYQDISLIRLNLVKQAAKKSKIVVVGDDWQSIYSFSGSNINLFYDFQKDMNAKTLIIKNTYRNSQKLIDIAGAFVMKDKHLIEKRLSSFKYNDNPLILVYYKNFVDTLEKVIHRIINEYGIKTKILILGRYNKDIEIIKSYKFKINKSKITYIYNRKIDITFMTIHASKGLGYDNVILINLSKGEYGFPSKTKIDKFKQYYFNFGNNIPEERRVFYVALTRTKNQVYFLVDKKNESCFIKEIKKEVKQLKI